jgi:hypothetical protein
MNVSLNYFYHGKTYYQTKRLPALLQGWQADEVQARFDEYTNDGGTTFLRPTNDLPTTYERGRNDLATQTNFCAFCAICVTKKFVKTREILGEETLRFHGRNT